MKISKLAAEYIEAHNGNGGLLGAIDRLTATILRRAADGKTSPKAQAILSELQAIRDTPGLDHCELMYFCRWAVGRPGLIKPEGFELI